MIFIVIYLPSGWIMLMGFPSEPLLGFGLAILIALTGWFLAARLRFPAPAILGPMILVGAASSVGWVQVVLPIWGKPALQIIVGTYLGYRIDRCALGRMRSLTRPAMLVTVWMISSAMLIGYLLAQTIHIDLTTAFLGSSPGGIAEMSAMAISLEGDVILVATLQALRIISTLLAIPMLVRGIDRRLPPGAPVKPPLVTEPQGMTTNPRIYKSVKPFIYLIVGALASLLFGALNFPAAGILGPLAAVAALRVSGIDFGPLPALLRSLVQVGGYRHRGGVHFADAQ